MEMTMKQAAAAVRSLGFVLTKRDGEYRLNKRGGCEATAYYTEDLEDAVSTAQNWNGPWSPKN